MKNVYILTKEQVEELDFIKRGIVSDIDIIYDILKDEPIRNSVKDAVWSLLLRIESHCNNMDIVLEIE